MAGYIGSKSSVTQVDGYNRTEADGRYVNASGDTMTGTLSVTGVDRNEDALRVGASSAGTGYGLRIGASGATDPLEIWREHSSGDQMQLSVDYYGRVTMPYQPHFVVKANYGSHTVLNSVSPDWSVVYRNNGGHFNTSTNTFTVPVTGLYFFRTHALIDKSANSGYNYAYAQFYFNGTLYTDIAHTPSNGTTSYIDIALTAVVYLQAGDTVQARYTTVNGAAFYAGSTYNAFSGYLVS